MGVKGALRLHKCVRRRVLCLLSWIPLCQSSRLCLLQVELCIWLDAYLRTLVVLSRVLRLLQEDATLIANEWAVHSLGADVAVAIGTLS